MALSRKTASVLVAIVAGAQVSIAQDGAKSEGFIDSAMRDFEVGQHERLLRVQSAPGAALSKFTTDGCSGGLSAVWETATGAIAAIATRHGRHPPWEACCVAHDRLYHAGAPAGTGAGASFNLRLSADTALRQCVQQTGEERAASLAAEYGISESDVRRLYDGLADILYRAVRIGGAPCTGLSWRWGYGWAQCE